MVKMGIFNSLDIFLQPLSILWSSTIFEHWIFEHWWTIFYTDELYSL